MTLRAYLMPITGDGTHGNAYRVKYAAQLGNNYNGYMWSPSTSNRSIVIVDLTTLQHTTLLLNLDVVPLDPNFNIGLLDLVTLNLGGESLGFPINGWTAINMPYTTVVRRVYAMIMVSQRMSGLGENILSIGFEDPLSYYSSNDLTAFYQAIYDMGFDSSNLVNTMTLREALEDISSQNDGNAVTGSAGNI